MSLNLTPVSTPQGKPLPPSRSKRLSTILGSSLGSSSSSLHRPSSQSLLEWNEDDLARLSREELVDHLRAQRDEREKVGRIPFHSPGQAKIEEPKFKLETGS